MRRRLLLSTLAAVAAAVVLLGAPLAVAVRGLLVQQSLDELEQLAEGARIVLDQATSREAELVLALLAERADARVMLLSPAGDVIADSAGAPRGAVATGPDVAVAAEGRVGRARGDGLLTVAVPAEQDGVNVILRATSTDEGLRRAVRRAWLQIAGVAVIALAVAALIAWGQGQRLAAPLEQLAASARRLGQGDFSARAPRSGLPEADDVGRALDTTAARLAAMLERSSSFSADASHQLRTPLTALRLHLEALEATATSTGDGDRERLLAAAMAEADRLDTTIEELLALAAAPAGSELLDLAALVDERVTAWEALARAHGRRVVVEHGTVPAVRARAAAIGQCLQVLLDNALVHGEGTITVLVQAIGGVDRDRAGARLCVADEGPGFPPDADAPDQAGTPGGGGSGSRQADQGRGLALARSLVEAEGGRLQIGRGGPGATVCLLLPADG